MLNKDSLLSDNHFQPTPTPIIVLCVSSCHKFNASNSLDTHGAKLLHKYSQLRANQQTQVHAYVTNKLKEKREHKKQQRLRLRT